MVIPLQPVNGLAPEILFFLKKMDAEQFSGGIQDRTPPFWPRMARLPNALRNAAVRIPGLIHF
jgi:hypothetical protein